MVRNGLIFGAILAALHLGNSLIQWLAGAFVVSTHTVNGFTSANINDTAHQLCSAASSSSPCLRSPSSRACWRHGGLVRSVLAASRPGRRAFGALVGGICSLVVNIVLVAPGLQAPADSSMTPSQVQALFIGTSVAGLILGLFLDAGIGAGMGALGGLIGAKTYRKSLPVGPAPFAPVYPGMPGMPGAGPASQPWPSPTPQYPPQYPRYPLEYPSQLGSSPPRQ